MDTITVAGAREHNLADIDVTIPRGAITAVVGRSGSGKTSLVFDTIAAEAQRQLNDTFTAFARHRLPSPARPEVDQISGLSPVVVVDQRRLGGGTRSTVGTVTDVSPLMRLLFSRASTPFVGESTAFSFNDPSGMCPRCHGLGTVVTPLEETFLDLDRSLAEGAILTPGYGYKAGKEQYRYRKLRESGLFDLDLPLREWPRGHVDALLHTADARATFGDSVPDDYEGLRDVVDRIYVNADSDGTSKAKRNVLERFATATQCPECDGSRLNEAARTAQVGGHTLPSLLATELSDLVVVVEGLEVPEAAAQVRDALLAQLRALDEIGLGYLTLDRATATLSGGESQRIKLVRHLGSSLTEMLYVFDEPSIGLHPADVERLVTLLERIRDHGNTVLVVDHDLDVVAAADHVVELGPGAGTTGGRVVHDGTVATLREDDTATGEALRRTTGSAWPSRRRASSGVIELRDLTLHNLRGIDVDLPLGVLTAFTGVAGSGKSSLVAELVRAHPEVVLVDQSAVRGNRRSTVATFSGIADPVREMFAAANGVGTSLFSANSDGACPECRGLGVIHTDLAFLPGYDVVCPRCHGRRFSEEVLAYRVDDRSIADVWDLTAAEAVGVLTEPPVADVLRTLDDVGVGYLGLGQALSSLSGGERQRMKLARELGGAADGAVDGGTVYVLDEPTTGLHPADIGLLVDSLDRLVDAGHTVVLVEHDLDVIAHADHVIDLGPCAGRDGGRLLFTGPVDELLRAKDSVTADQLRRHGAVAG